MVIWCVLFGIDLNFLVYLMALPRKDTGEVMRMFRHAQPVKLFESVTFTGAVHDYQPVR